MKKTFKFLTCLFVAILCFGEGAQAGAIAQAGFTDYIFKF